MGDQTRLIAEMVAKEMHQHISTGKALAKQHYEKKVPDPAVRTAIEQVAATGIDLMKARISATRELGCMHPRLLVLPFLVSGKAFAICPSCARLLSA